MSRPLIIAIDGPSGAGKSTLGRMLARKLNLLYIDTGSMYRAVALVALEDDIDPHDEVALAALAADADIDLSGDPDSLRVTLAGRDVSEAIRSEAVTRLASLVSTVPAVRRALVERQRELGKRGAILNGRDIGTVVFPDADVKFFLTAVAEERAQRRFNELQTPELTLEETLTEINERDRRDTTRADSPLAVAADATVIDSTGQSIDQVFAEMMRVIQDKVAEDKDG
ncbi:MAG TPA: (d)CMP kinase [Pyrinomonadaceae bacterium]|nr:(d)CMP kinase [Pyrinomonadaceae bacterium]